MIDFSQLEMKLVYRSLGKKTMSDRLGVGFMHKRPGTRDNTSDHYSLVYVLAGEGVFEDVTGTHQLTAGMVFQRIPRLKHATRVATDWRECFVALPTVLYHSLNDLGMIPGHPNVMDIGVNPALVSRYYETMQTLQDAPEKTLPAMMGSIITLLTDTLSSVYSDRDTQMVETACNVLGSRLDSRLTVPEICKEKGWGYERFRKVFQQHIGMSPGKYRIRRRMDAACEYLQDRDLGIAEIAESLGYPSAFEFSGQFKKQTGMSPSEFRNQG